MLQDNMHRVPDECFELGSKTFNGQYNGHDFTLQVTAHPRERSSNDRAVKLQGLNLEANIRKGLLGMGHGQFLEPSQLKSLDNGQVTLSTRIAGKFYKIPIAVTPNGDYLVPEISRRAFGSLRDVAALSMDRLFEHNGVDNVYKQNSSAHRQPAPQPSAMRM